MMIDKLDKKTQFEVAQLIGAEVPHLEISDIYKLIRKFDFCGDVKDLSTEGYDKDALQALDKLKMLFDAL